MDVSCNQDIFVPANIMLATVYVFTALIQIVLLKNSARYNTTLGQLKSKSPHSMTLFIEAQDNRGASTSCRSSVLNQEVLLTAASCVHTQDKVEAVIGNKITRNGTLLAVSHIRRHSKFNEETFSHDIALLGLKSPLQLGAKVKRVVLVKHAPHTGAAGHTTTPFSLASKAKRRRFKDTSEEVFSRKECRAHVGSTPKKTFCVRYPGIRAVNDIAGSAFVQEHIVETGLLSYENDPTSNSTIAVYTNVSLYHRWIDSNVRKLASSFRAGNQELSSKDTEEKSGSSSSSESSRSGSSSDSSSSSSSNSSSTSSSTEVSSYESSKSSSSESSS